MTSHPPISCHPLLPFQSFELPVPYGTSLSVVRLYLQWIQVSARQTCGCWC